MENKQADLELENKFLRMFLNSQVAITSTLTEGVKSLAERLVSNKLERTSKRIRNPDTIEKEIDEAVFQMRLLCLTHNSLSNTSDRIGFVFDAMKEVVEKGLREQILQMPDDALCSKRKEIQTDGGIPTEVPAVQ